jgi:transposase
MLARRNKQLAASRTRTVCRLHAVIRELVEGGTGLKLKAGKAKLLLEQFEPASPVQVVRHQIALEHLDDLAHVDAQIAELHAGIRGAVAAANTSVTEIHGVGAIVAAMVIGYSGDITRFRDRNHYAAYTGTAPIELSSGDRVIHRLSRRGNRQLNHAMHLAALSQIRFPDTAGRVFYDRKIAEGRTGKDAYRALKRRISDAVYRQLQVDAGLR